MYVQYVDGYLIILFMIGKLFFILVFITAVRSQFTCDIVIAGGTLAALGAAIQSPSSLKVCLIEPTDRLGGQLGDEGVWHIDFNWLYQSGYPDRTVAYNHANLHGFFHKLTSQCNTGDCWVSRNCFMYSCVQAIIKEYLDQRIQSGNLSIYYNSVVKTVQTEGREIKSIVVIKRQQIKQDCRSANERIQDWYSHGDSMYYSKIELKFNVNKYIIQATQYGDVLVLADAEYMQGTNRSNKCGQSIVFGLHQLYNQNSTSIEQDKDKAKIKSEDDDFSLASFTVDEVWRYRRLIGKGINPKQNQLTLQNWNGPGNDYKYGYLFLNEDEFSKDDWKGGINYTTIRQAEARSLRYHQWFKAISKLPLEATGKYFKTCSGTSRLPYIRDGRRSVGYKGFIMQPEDVTTKFIPNVKLTATPFTDRIALGYYNMDIHDLQNCTYDPFPRNTPLPFYLPARAFTNRKISNLIVAGRAMSQQFYTSSATRTHVTQFHSGVSSILMATYLIGRKQPSTWALIDCPECITQFQSIIRQKMPLQWTINGQKYPNNQQQNLSED